LLLFIPLLWTGPPIPHPDCVEIIDADTVILHAEPTMDECDDWLEIWENLDYYRGLGYNRTGSNMHVVEVPGGLEEQGTITMEKIK
jgi:hypothetical protein